MSTASSILQLKFFMPFLPKKWICDGKKIFFAKKLDSANYRVVIEATVPAGT